MKRIAKPKSVVFDGGTGFANALKKVWPQAEHQRCVFHVFCQVKRYTTFRPNTAAGVELYMLAKIYLKSKVKRDHIYGLNVLLNGLKSIKIFLVK